MDFLNSDKKKNIKGDDLDFVLMPELEGDEKGKPEERPSKGFHLDKFRLTTISGNRKWLVLAGMAALIILLALAGFFLLRKPDISAPPQQTSGPADIVIDESPSPAEQDPDNDGLVNRRESVFGTEAENPDTDGDGLADGDEVNIYKSDPLLPDTDADGFNDGREVARNFSPITNSPDKAPVFESEGWKADIEKFGLHEPTLSTLKNLTESLGDATFVYQNTVFGYQLSISSFLSFREANNLSEVGLYVAGTEPGDENLATDPIFINIAAKIDGQSLADWVGSQYSPGQYQKKDEVSLDGITGIKLSGLSGGICPADKHFFEKGNTVIILTLTCNTDESMLTFYTDIVRSFRLQ
jgi:hypothetical protein